MRPTEKQIKKAEKPARVEHKETHFDDRMRDFVMQQESGAIDFQYKCFEQRQGKETEMLVAHGEAREAAFCGSLAFSEGEQRYFDVGIGSDVVG